MTKEVEIIIKGTALEEAGAADNQVETRCKAEYFERNGFHYVTYEERVEGVKTPIKNWLKFRENYLEMRKTGALNSQMTFEEGKKYMTGYRTPYGTMLLGVLTHKLDVQIAEDRIAATIRYDLDSEEQLVSKMHLQMSIQPR